MKITVKASSSSEHITDVELIHAFREEIESCLVHPSLYESEQAFVMSVQKWMLDHVAFTLKQRWAVQKLLDRLDSRQQASQQKFTMFDMLDPEDTFNTDL